MKKSEIKTISKECGEHRIYFSTDKLTPEINRVDRIKEESSYLPNDDFLIIYRGYKNGKLAFQIPLDKDVVTIYEQ